MIRFILGVFTIGFSFIGFLISSGDYDSSSELGGVDLRIFQYIIVAVSIVALLLGIRLVRK
jgi:hypothetical protein